MNELDEPLGGSYRDVPARGGEAHHIPADRISPIPRDYGPALRMDRADHMLTQSWGRSAQATAWRAQQKDLIDRGAFRQAQQMDIDDVRAKFGSKYEEGISQMLTYSVQVEQQLERSGFVLRTARELLATVSPNRDGDRVFTMKRSGYELRQSGRTLTVATKFGRTVIRSNGDKVSLTATEEDFRAFSAAADTLRARQRQGDRQRALDGPER